MLRDGHVARRHVAKGLHRLGDVREIIWQRADKDCAVLHQPVDGGKASDVCVHGLPFSNRALLFFQNNLRNQKATTYIAPTKVVLWAWSTHGQACGSLLFGRKLEPAGYKSGGAGQQISDLLSKPRGLLPGLLSNGRNKFHSVTVTSSASKVM